MNVNAKAYHPNTLSLRADATVYTPLPLQGKELSPIAPSFTPSNIIVPERGIQKPICRFFINGACRKGLDCPYLHQHPLGNEVASPLEGGNLNNSGTSTFDHPVAIDAGILCVFGAGASVVNLRLGKSEDASVVVSGLHPFVSQHDVEARLSPFGELLSLTVQVGAGDSRYATATFSHTDMASAAVNALHGSPIESWIGLVSSQRPRQINNNGKSTAVSVVLKSSSATSTSGLSLKVQWYAPSRCAWVAFREMWQAERAAKLCNGMELKGRKIDVKYQRPSRSKLCSSFSVWVGNLDGYVTSGHLKSFFEQNIKYQALSVSLGSLPFKDKDGPRIVQNLLQVHGGPITSFEVATNTDPLRRKALVKFSRASDAIKACSFLEKHHKINELGGSKLFAQKIFTLKYVAPSTVMDAVKHQIETLLGEKDGVRLTFYARPDATTILIHSDSEHQIMKLKTQLDWIVSGDVVRDEKHGGRVLWNRYFLSNQFPDDLLKAVGSDINYVWCNRRRQEVRVFGDERCRQRLGGKVQELCSHQMINTHALPIQRKDYETILRSGRDLLDKLIRMSGSRSISLDIKNHSLLVEGGDEEVLKTKLCLAKMQRDHTAASLVDLCPVCFCMPEDVADVVASSSVVRLTCKHNYCRECFETWLKGTHTCSFPLICLAENCSSPVALVDLANNLGGDDLSALLRVAVDDHVRKNTPRLQFCPTPTCSGIYDSTTGTTSTCSTCLSSICNECNATHEGIDCREYKLATLDPDTIRLKIVDEILTLHCPRCRQAFFDFEGCFALTCSVCPCKFCGWCLADCGDHDAHPHVKTCASKEPGADLYFGSREQFEAAQNKKRCKELKAYLQSLPLAKRVVTLASLEKDLTDLGLQTTILGGML